MGRACERGRRAPEIGSSQLDRDLLHERDMGHSIEPASRIEPFIQLILEKEHKN